MKADGNCLFRCFDFFLHPSEEMTPGRVRQGLVDYVQQNAELFCDDVVQSGFPNMADYCAYMLRDGTWGDGIMLQAFSLWTRVNLYLLYPTGKFHLLHFFGEGALNIALIFENKHYDVAIPLQ